MPELPEVETMRRGIARVAGGTVCEAVRVACDLKPIKITPRIDVLRRRAVGQRIMEVGRIGKRVCLRLESDDSLIFEPRMTGLVLLTDPPDVEHLRFRLGLSNCPVAEVLFWDRRGLGTIQLLSPAEVSTKLGEGRLGPDALEVSADRLQSQCDRSRQAIKVALLDQRRIAGIGNLYASEILHVAGLHPNRRCNQLTRAQWQAVHKAMLLVLTDAVRYEGSTLSDGTYRNALNTPGRYQHHHRVYDRAGLRCTTCNRGIVRRLVQAQRSTFYCPRCQRKGREE